VWGMVRELVGKLSDDYDFGRTRRWKVARGGRDRGGGAAAKTLMGVLVGACGDNWSTADDAPPLIAVGLTQLTKGKGRRLRMRGCLQR